jgi:hypothetical protein
MDFFSILLPEKGAGLAKIHPNKTLSFILSRSSDVILAKIPQFRKTQHPNIIAQIISFPFPVSIQNSWSDRYGMEIYT